MQFENVEVRNYMEEVVESLIEEVIKDIDVCKCKRCAMDIAAIALNKLPPKYIATRKGEIYSKINILRQQFEVDVVAAITKAAVEVKKSPRHE